MLMDERDTVVIFSASLHIAINYGLLYVSSFWAAGVFLVCPLRVRPFREGNACNSGDTVLPLNERTDP